ncbi:transcriptional regulator [Chitinolyticbacter meiyuanensis]|uniref:transcriptional regulator n=1 Tax=Chitinolyticbacter meiyuanensis TaxID=682798 RepID=UPI001C9E3954|nr:YdaS family helix-turn-helix protein [Chitinolyticbacter meiyuanensis]
MSTAFKSYFFGLDKMGRELFATQVGSSVGYLTLVANGHRMPGSILCVDIERASGGAVRRRDLRPDDWLRRWPELAVVAGSGRRKKPAKKAA